MFQTMLIGHLGQDATRQQVNDKEVISFSVAVSKKYKDQNGAEQQRTTWINASYWPRVAGSRLPEFLKKGTQVFVQGEISARAYTKDNQVFAALNLTANRVDLLGGKREQQPAEQTTTPTPAADEITEPLDDLPF